jgi:heptosyltransferase-2
VTGPSRLLVRLPNWLGDLLLARPLLHALRAAHPEAELRAVGPAWGLELLAAERLLDRLDPWPATGRAREVLAREVRAWGPAAALVLPPSFSSAWFAWRCGAPLRIGHRGDGRSPLLTHALPRRARGELHLSREFLELGAVVGAALVPVPALAVPAGARAAAAALREAHGVPGGARTALLGPRSAWGPAREWPAERFAGVGRALGEAGFWVLVCGTAAERADCERVAREAGPRATAIAGETNLPMLAALCAEAAVAVCNDSGLAHLAAATGAKTLQIYGSAASAWTHALGDRVRVVQRPPVCSPCYQRTCRIGYRCLTAIETEAIVRACRELAA